MSILGGSDAIGGVGRVVMTRTCVCACVHVCTNMCIGVCCVCVCMRLSSMYVCACLILCAVVESMFRSVRVCGWRVLVPGCVCVHLLCLPWHVCTLHIRGAQHVKHESTRTKQQTTTRGRQELLQTYTSLSCNSSIQFNLPASSASSCCPGNEAYT